MIQEPRCTFLFLKRGAGKSANRVQLKNWCDKSLVSESPKLGVAYTDFHRLIKNDQVTLADHVDEILREAVPKLYTEVISSKARKKKIADLPVEYQKDFVWRRLTIR